MRPHLRTVSASGHSHAVSMWACPVAMTRWAPERAGTARAPATAALAAAAAPSGEAATRSRAATIADRSRDRRGSSVGSVRITPSRTSRSWTSASASGSTTTSSARSSRYSGRSPAVSGDPIDDGRNCGNVGFDAASTTSSTGPGPPLTGTAWRRGWTPWTRTALGVADEALALEAGGVDPEPEVDERLDATTRPVSRHLAGEPEPRRRPRSTPPLADGERLQRIEGRPGLDGERPAMRVDEGQDPLVQLPGDPLLDEVAVVVHPLILSHPGRCNL